MIGVLVLVLLVGIAGLIVVASRRLQGQSLTGQMFRRGFQYVLLYALVIIVASGAADLLGRTVGTAPTPGDEFLLAQSLTAVLIALPITGGLAWWIYRTHRREPTERDSLLYQAYVTAASLTGATMTAVGLQQTVSVLIGSTRFNGEALAEVVIWGMVWAVHWRLVHRGLGPHDTIAHTLLGSALGLVWAAMGLIQLLSTSLQLLAGPDIIVGVRLGLGSAAGLLVSGVLIWMVYWWIAARNMPRTTAWHAYVLLLGVAGSLITALVAAQSLMWRVLVAWFGDAPAYTNWLEWYEGTAALVVGATLWWYHHAILDPTDHTPVRRVYRYVVSGIGVIAAAGGLGLLVVSLVDAIAPATLFQRPFNTLLGALTLLVIGTIVWWVHWRVIQRDAELAPEAELNAIPRRIYLVMLLGGAGIVVVITLISGVVDLVHDVMQAQVSLATLYKIRTELGFLTAGLALVVYHAAILRQDQYQMPNQPSLPVRDGILTLVGPIEPLLATALSSRFVGPVRHLPIESASTWDVDAVLTALDTFDPTTDVVIIARDDGIESYPATAIRELQ